VHRHDLGVGGVELALQDGPVQAHQRQAVWSKAPDVPLDGEQHLLVIDPGGEVGMAAVGHDAVGEQRLRCLDNGLAGPGTAEVWGAHEPSLLGERLSS
jgi:hypothetical protein